MLVDINRPKLIHRMMRVGMLVVTLTRQGEQGEILRGLFLGTTKKLPFHSALTEILVLVLVVSASGFPKSAQRHNRNKGKRLTR